MLGFSTTYLAILKVKIKCLTSDNVGIKLWKMLTDDFRVVVNNPFKKIFMGKRKKKKQLMF